MIAVAQPARSRDGAVGNGLGVAVAGAVRVRADPLFCALGDSLKGDDEFFGRGLSPLPPQFLWSNYLDAWRGASFGR